MSRITNPCPSCGGEGYKVYSDTSTWRHSGGGQTITTDVCDVCWGSRTTERTFTDLRAVSRRVRDLEAGLLRAQEWLEEEGCDCGTDEPGTCALCHVRRLLRCPAPQPKEPPHRHSCRGKGGEWCFCECGFELGPHARAISPPHHWRGTLEPVLPTAEGREDPYAPAPVAARRRGAMQAAADDLGHDIANRLRSLLDTPSQPGEEQ